MRLQFIVGLCLVALIFAACSPSEIAADTGSPPLTTTTTDLSTTSTTVVPTTTTTEAPVEIEIKGGEVVGGPKTLKSEIGVEVHIVVTSDQAGHIHVHGYDLFFEVTPEKPAEIIFVADVPGVFEIELEDSHTLIAELEVS